MAETWRHAGAVIIGTTAERGAFDTSVLRPDNRWFDTDLSAFLLWEGTAWVHRFADNAYFLEKVGIGTETVPHGAVGAAMLALDGANASVDGPHIQLTTASDDYPLLQVLAWQHDDVSINFDAYYDTAGTQWESSDAGSNFQIYKLGDQLLFRVDSGIAQGVIVPWGDTVMYMDTSAYVGLSISPTVRLDVYGTDEPSSTIRLLRLEVAATGPTFILHQTRGAAAAGVIGDDLGYIEFEGHDNLANDTIYAQIDAEIVDPQNAIEEGRLYLRTMQTGVVQSAIEITTHAVINNLTDIRGVGANKPDLGTTTAAEKWGNIYVASLDDAFLEGDDFATFNRWANYNNTGIVTDHYRGNGEEAAWVGWAAYVGFVGPPDGLFYDRPYSNQRYQHTAVANRRVFRYRAAVIADIIYLRARVSLSHGCEIGLMIDDGVDTGDGEGADNFIRIVLRSTAAAADSTIRQEFRTGGGVLTTTTAMTISPLEYVGFLLLAGSGTRWGGPWAAGTYYFGEANSNGLFSWTGGYTWTPARVGIYWKAITAPATYPKGWVDWYAEGAS